MALMHESGGQRDHAAGASLAYLGDDESSQSLPSTPRLKRVYHYSFRSDKGHRATRWGHNDYEPEKLVNRVAEMRLSDGSEAARLSSGHPSSVDRMMAPSSAVSHHRSMSCRTRARRPPDLNLALEEEGDADGPCPRRRTYSMPTRNRGRKSRNQRLADADAIRDGGGGGGGGGGGEDSYVRVRTFSTSSKGIVNRGDSFKKKCVSLHSSTDAVELSGLAVTADPHLGQSLEAFRPRTWSNTSQGSSVASAGSSADTPRVHKVFVLGSHGVGKTSLIQQFMTSEYMGNADSTDDEETRTVSVLLDGTESTLEFKDQSPVDGDVIAPAQGDVYVVVYAVNDKDTFDDAVDGLHDMRKKGMLGLHAVILVANKGDIVRGREVNEEEGKVMAVRYDSKYIEVSAVMNHKVDELLVGILKQSRLNEKRLHKQKRKAARCMPDDTGCIPPARGIVGRIFKRNPHMFRSCDNLLVL